MRFSRRFKLKFSRLICVLVPISSLNPVTKGYYYWYAINWNTTNGCELYHKNRAEALVCKGIRVSYVCRIVKLNLCIIRTLIIWWRITDSNRLLLLAKQMC